MAIETFGWPVEAKLTAEHKFAVRTVKFGDGYEQRQALSLRPKLQTWEGTLGGLPETLSQVRAFLDAHAGVRAFYWTPPGRERLLVKVAEYREAHQGGKVWQLSWKFEEVLA